MEILKTIYDIYLEDLKTEDTPPIRKELAKEIKEHTIVELDGNFYMYIHKIDNETKLIYGFLATPYTLLAPASGKIVKTDSPLYEYLKIVFHIPITTTKEIIEQHITDLIQVENSKEEIELKLKEHYKNTTHINQLHYYKKAFLKNESKRSTKYLYIP
jgi:hypothetical protein